MYAIREIQSKVRQFAAALPISRVTLVGSYARNTATDHSDIDLVVDGQDLSDAYWDFLFQLEDAFATKVDLLTAKGVKKSVLHSNIMEGGIVLYEA